MPPKKQQKASNKTEQKRKEKIIEVRINLQIIIEGCVAMPAKMVADKDFKLTLIASDGHSRILYPKDLNPKLSEFESSFKSKL